MNLSLQSLCRLFEEHVLWIQCTKQIQFAVSTKMFMSFDNYLCLKNMSNVFVLDKSSSVLDVWMLI